MNTNEAFEILLKRVDTELEKAQRLGSTYFTRGDTVKARKSVDQVEKLQDLVKAVRQLQTRWREIIPDPKPQQPVLPVIQKMQRTPPGIKTPQRTYRLPILQALVAKGGEGSADLVLKQVKEIMVDVLNDFDQQPLASRNEPRWRNTAMWERWSMVRDGLLSDKSPYGTWEITERGKEFLKHG